MPDWREQALLGLHHEIQTESAAEGAGIAGELSAETLREELLRVRPDYVQLTVQGPDGLAMFPSRCGTPVPGLRGDPLRIYRDVSGELGLPLVVGISALRDAAAVRREPGQAHRDALGEPDPARLCPSGGWREERLAPLLEELAEAYRIDGVRLLGSEGEMEADAGEPCACPRCRAGILARSDRQEGLPPAGGRGGAAWSELRQENRSRHLRLCVGAVRALAPGCLVGAGWEAADSEPDYLSLAVPAGQGPDRTSVLARLAAARGRPWEIVVPVFLPAASGTWALKTPAHLCQEAAVVLAAGGAVALRCRLQPGGHPAGWHSAVTEQAARFCRERAAVCRGTTPLPQAVVLRCSAASEREDAAGADSAVEGAVRALQESGWSTAAVKDASAFQGCTLLVIPEQPAPAPAVRRAVARFVAGGGRLLVTGAAAAEVWGDLLGAAAEGESYRGARCVATGAGPALLAGPWQPVRPEGSRPLLPLLDPREPSGSGSHPPAATVRAQQAGRAAGFFGPLFAGYDQLHSPALRSVLQRLLQALEAERQAEADESLELSVRRRGRVLFVHLVNLGCEPSPGPRRPLVVRVPPRRFLAVRVRAPAPPLSVRLVPGAVGLHWTWNDGLLTVHVPEVGIHEVLEIEASARGRSG